MRFVERGEFAGAKRFMPTIKSDNHEVGYVIKKMFSHTIDRLKHLIETEYEANIRRKRCRIQSVIITNQSPFF
ncbi:hypothetical protein GCM10020331_102590 [Ectobacillus funiculus]